MQMKRVDLEQVSLCQHGFLGGLWRGISNFSWGKKLESSRPSQIIWRWGNWRAPRVSDLHNSTRNSWERLTGSLECSLPGTELFPQRCPVNWREPSGSTWKIILKSNSPGDKAFADKDVKLNGKSPYWKSPGPFSPGESSEEEYIWLTLTFWYKGCLTMRWLGLAGVVIMTSWQPKWEESRFMAWNPNPTTVQKQRTINCQVLRTSGDLYLGKSGHFLLPTSVFKIYHDTLILPLTVVE